MAGSTTARRLWLGADVVFLLLFVMSVFVQINDPDPGRWIAIYGAAAIATGLSLFDRVPRWLPMLIAGVAIVWGLAILPRVLGRVPFLEMFAAWEMKNAGIEESREMYGLVLVAAWMLVIAWRRRVVR